MKALIMAHKAAVLAQVREILTRYPVSDVTLAYPIEGGRMSERLIRTRLEPWIEGIRVTFRPFNLFQELRQFQKLVRDCHSDVVAIPFAGGRPYYRLRRCARKESRFIVISDGTAESSGLLDFYRRIRIKKTLDWVKVLVMAAEVAWFARADEAYSLFYPLKSCFAERTFPAARLRVPEEVVGAIRRLVPSADEATYVAQGYGVVYEDVVRKFGLQNPVTTTKRPIDADDFFTGEDVVDVLRPRRIVGYCTEVLMYAKKYYPETECIAIMAPETDRAWGRYHNAVYKRQAALVGDIRFLSYEEYLKL